MSLTVRRNRTFQNWWEVWQHGYRIATMTGGILQMEPCTLTGAEASKIAEWMRMFLMGEDLPAQKDEE